MRGLLHKRADGTATLWWWNNAGEHSARAEGGGSTAMARNARSMASAPGFYRVRIDDDGWPTKVTAIKHPSDEISKIRARLAKDPPRVATRMPGVVGYQQREDAARQAQESARLVSRRFVERLETELRGAPDSMLAGTGAFGVRTR